MIAAFSSEHMYLNDKEIKNQWSVLDMQLALACYINIYLNVISTAECRFNK